MAQSPAEIFASHPKTWQKDELAKLSADELERLHWQWRGWNARPEQLAPAGKWPAWLVLAGRGFGKTRLGAEWVRDLVRQGYSRIHMIAPTAADSRDVMVEGTSGLLSVCWELDRTAKGDHLGRPLYEPSKRRVTWANGAQAILFSAEEPDRLRGPQAEALWCDELAAWSHMQETWDMAMFGLRLGKRTPALVTTTPKPFPLVRALAADKRNAITRGATWDNKTNLAATFFESIVSKYQGTRLGRQELDGEILEEAEGALWKRDDIRYMPAAPDLARIVVAIDPATTSKEESALTGIVVVGMGFNKVGYVLADYSGRYSPGEWAAKAIEAYKLHQADCIVAEKNQGGDMVLHTLNLAAPGQPVKLVHASRAKQARAEPISLLYQQGRVYHVGAFPDLEDELCTWAPMTGAASPDRLDALVWALTELSIEGSSVVFSEPEAYFRYDPKQKALPDFAVTRSN